MIPTTFIEVANSILAFADRELEEIISMFKVRHTTSKELLLDYGQISKEVIFIEKGVLREYYLENGKEKTTWILGEGFFTYSLGSFMEQKPSNYRIETLEECTLYTIGKTDYELLVMSNPKVLLFNFLLQQRYLLHYEYRMELLRSDDAELKYKSFMATEGHLAQRASDKHIASYLHMTPSTLSKTRKKIMLKEKSNV